LRSDRERSAAKAVLAAHKLQAEDLPGKRS